MDNLEDRDFSNEMIFTSSRSGGPGGQNVNKVNSKVTLRFNIDSSQLLDENEKAKIMEKLSNKITGEGDLLITAETHRSQLKNKEEAVNKFHQLLEKAFKVKKKRKATKPSKTAVKKRLDSKRKHSEKKEMRQKP